MPATGICEWGRLGLVVVLVPAYLYGYLSGASCCVWVQVEMYWVVVVKDWTTFVWAWLVVVRAVTCDQRVLTSCCREVKPTAIVACI